MTGGGRWTFSQNFSSLALTVWEWRCLEDIFTKYDLATQFINQKGVCRTAPATPGLLIIKGPYYHNLYKCGRTKNTYVKCAVSYVMCEMWWYTLYFLLDPDSMSLWRPPHMGNVHLILKCLIIILNTSTSYTHIWPKVIRPSRREASITGLEKKNSVCLLL